MVSSGFRYGHGIFDHYTTFKSWINADLPRPPKVGLRAWYRRVNDTLRLYTRVHNTSTLSLDSAANDARVWGLTGEKRPEARFTGMPALRAVSTPLEGMDPGTSADHTIELAVHPLVDWETLFSVAMVEYRTGGTTGKYDVLHAVYPQPAALTLSQEALQFRLPGGSGSTEVRFDGPPVLTWTALPHVPWLRITPDEGSIDTAALVRVVPGTLPAGQYDGEISFAATSADGMLFEVVLPVSLVLDQEAEAQEFPGVAGLPGQGGTRWRSSLSLANPSPDPQQVLVELLARDTGVTVAARTLTPAAGELLVIPDVYQHFDAPAGAGSLRITGSALTWVRTFNQADAGTFGQDVAGTGEGAWQPGQGVFFPINRPADPLVDSRSNLLILNLEDRAMTVLVTAADRAHTVTVPARTYVQVTNLGAELDLPPGPALVRVEADGAWSGSVSTVDGVTGDPTTVRGQSEPGEVE